jgi:hypothetical protein
MKSGRISTAIGLAVGVGPAIVAYLMPRLATLDKLGPVVLGVILGMQAASRRRTRHGRRGPEETEAIEHAQKVASGPRSRGMNDQTAGRIAREIIKYLRLSNRRFHRGPPTGGHWTPGPPQRP